MRPNTTIKLEVDDKAVLRPINILDIAYNTWCKSHSYNVGDAQRVSLYIIKHFKNYTDLSQLEEFKMLLEDCASTLDISKLQDESIVRWCGIFLIACEDWRAPINPQKNVSVRVSQVDFAKPLSYIPLVLRSLQLLGTSLKRSAKKNP
jgi:hypothetical protein